MSQSLVELQPRHVYVSTSNVSTSTIQSTEKMMVHTVVEESSADMATDIDSVTVQELDGNDGLDDDDRDLQLLDMADHSYSSQGSLEIDLDAHLDEDSTEGE